MHAANSCVSLGRRLVETCDRRHRLRRGVRAILTPARCASFAKRWRAIPASRISRLRCRVSARARSLCSALTRRRKNTFRVWLRARRSLRLRCQSPKLAPMSRRCECDAKLTGDSYVLNGEKTWISNGGIADFYVLFARTNEAPGSRGITAFIVDAETPGFEIAERYRDDRSASARAPEIHELPRFRPIIASASPARVSK